MTYRKITDVDTSIIYSIINDGEHLQLTQEFEEDSDEEEQTVLMTRSVAVRLAKIILKEMDEDEEEIQ